jgi:hypothetical protein
MSQNISATQDNSSMQAAAYAVNIVIAREQRQSEGCLNPANIA